MSTSLKAIKRNMYNIWWERRFDTRAQMLSFSEPFILRCDLCSVSFSGVVRFARNLRKASGKYAARFIRWSQVNDVSDGLCFCLQLVWSVSGWIGTERDSSEKGRQADSGKGDPRPASGRDGMAKGMEFLLDPVVMYWICIRHILILVLGYCGVRPGSAGKKLNLQGSGAEEPRFQW
jgi:hypothetical protein